jgi:hypothetical protein
MYRYRWKRFQLAEVNRKEQQRQEEAERTSTQGAPTRSSCAAP